MIRQIVDNTGATVALITKRGEVIVLTKPAWGLREAALPIARPAVAAIAAPTFPH